MQAEIRVLKQQAWGHPELGQARKDPPLETSEEVWHWWHLDFRFLHSRTVVLSHPVWALCYSSHRRLIQIRSGLAVRWEVWAELGPRWMPAWCPQTSADQTSRTRAGPTTTSRMRRDLPNPFKPCELLYTVRHHLWKETEGRQSECQGTTLTRREGLDLISYLPEKDCFTMGETDVQFCPPHCPHHQDISWKGGTRGK